MMSFKQEELWQMANERIPWHDRLDGEEAIQKRVHEWVASRTHVKTQFLLL